MKIIEGKVPGFSYAITKGACSFCGRPDTYVLRVSTTAAVCEACSILTNWAWRQVEGVGVPGAAYSTEIKFVLLIIARDRPDDPVNPFDVIMVGRKDEHDAFGAPGGKVDPGEKPEDAAVRELHEETGLVTWPAALEVLHTAYSPRSSLGRVYLVRGYHGELPRLGINAEGQPIGWKLWPPTRHAKHLAGFYIGACDAFMMRWRLQKQAAATTPMSLRLSRPAVDYLTTKFSPMPDAKDEFALSERQRMLEGYSSVMTSEESEICGLIATGEERRAGELVVRKKPVAPTPPPPAPEKKEPEDEEQAAEVEGDEPLADGEYAPPEAPSESDKAAGFARPTAPIRRGP
jgi:8-oxo-dGTP pyrophosphatase MutT (NUDIX family)